MKSADTPSPKTETGHATCPASDVTWMGGVRPALEGFRVFDQLRNQADQCFFSQGNGFHVLLRHDDILQAARDTETWSNDYFVDPSVGGSPPFKLKPVHLDPPEHQPWRKLLAPYFSPGRIRTLDARMRQVMRILVDDLVDRGSCDFVKDISLRYPTAVFLEMLGLDLENLAQFLEWETSILHPGPDSRMGPVEAQDAVCSYFRGLVAERRASPDSQRGDLISEALSWELNGAPLTDDDLEAWLLMMFEAGLDTVTAQLSYAWLHLATHPRDRELLLEDPSRTPAMVEELLRLYPTVNLPRAAKKDTVIGECTIKQGDYVVLCLASSGRDERIHERPFDINLDRTQPHLSFGAGPHRCLGSHLARHEMVVALEEWHRVIPNYQVADGADVEEVVSTLFGLRNLPLTWSPT
jgi:cytochrome P450